MSIEQNTTLVRRLWQTVSEGDIDAALATFDDDATWWISGTFEGVSGTKKGKPEILAFLASVKGAFPSGLKPEIRKLYGDGDTVIAELINRGTSATGKRYENEYCFVFDVAGGKIRAIREYVDLEKARVAVSP